MISLFWGFIVFVKGHVDDIRLNKCISEYYNIHSVIFNKIYSSEFDESVRLDMFSRFVSIPVLDNSYSHADVKNAIENLKSEFPEIFGPALIDTKLRDLLYN